MVQVLRKVESVVLRIPSRLYIVLLFLLIGGIAFNCVDKVLGSIWIVGSAILWYMPSEKKGA